MLIKELVSSNQHIADIVIEVRRNGYLVDEWKIGYAEGSPSRYIRAWDKYDKVVGGIDKNDYYNREKPEWKEKHKTVARFPHFINKSINKGDNSNNYYELVEKNIPKAVMDMEVERWHSVKAYRGLSGTHELELIYITVEIGDKAVPVSAQNKTEKSSSDFEQLSLI